MDSGNMATKERIAVRVPCGWDVTASLAVFMVNLTKMSAEPLCPYEFNVGFVQNYKPADYARNKIVSDFLSDGSFSRLWFIDSDILPKKECMKLLISEDDIVGGTYDIWGGYKKEEPVRATRTAYVDGVEQKGWIPVPVPADGFYNVDAIGTGMMIIRKRVLADERMWIGGEKGAVFQNIYGPMRNIEISEDLDFCRRAKSFGYTVVAHGAINVGHVKTVNVADIVAYAETESAKHGGSPHLSVHAA